VSVETLQWLLVALGGSAAVVFIFAYRYAAAQTGARAAEQALPRADVVSRDAVAGAIDPGYRPDKRPSPGTMRTIRALQTGFIAFGIAAIFFMCSCLVSIVALYFIGS
jgi:hypothetical protein